MPGRSVPCRDMEDAALNRAIPAAAAESLREDGGLALASYPVFDIAAFRAGDLSPVIFGSALKGFGVRQLLDVLADGGPAPQAQSARPAPIQPDEPRLTGFVFKVQANMNPNHRDRIAFVRICSGTDPAVLKRLMEPTGR